VDLDATKAKQVEVITPQPTTPLTTRVDVARTFDATHSTNASWLPPSSYDSVWALPQDEPVTNGSFEFGTSWRLAQPVLTVDSGTRAFDDLLVQPGRTPISKGGHDYQAVYAGEGAGDAYTGLDAKGKAVVVHRSDTVSIQQQADAAAAAGAALLLVVNDGLGRLQPWTQDIWSAVAPTPPAVTVATLTADEGADLIARIQQQKTSLQVQSHPTTEYLYDIAHHTPTVPENPVYRPLSGDLARVAKVPTLTDPDPGHIGVGTGRGEHDKLDLYQGDTLVTSHASATMYVSNLSPANLPYRLVSASSRDGSTYSTSTRTEWAFASGHPAAGTTQGLLPLIQLDYAVDGIDDTGRTGRTAGLLVSPSHLSGGPGSETITQVSLDVSYDDGATWHKASLEHTAKGWRTRLDAPAGARFVTLRTTAQDTQGNSVTQDITRAFGLK
jgi:PA domain-containing protein